jgi:hypothetical protein
MLSAWHDPATIIHRTLFCLFLVMASLEVVIVMYGAFAARGRSGPSEPSRIWQQMYMIVTVALGWSAAITGTFWIYPRQLIAFGLRSASLQSRGIGSRELFAWMAAMAITMLAYVLMRYKGQIEEHRRIRGMAAVFAFAVLSATGIANGLGRLIAR